MSIPTLQDKELQQHYDALFAMFASDGWKAFQEQVKAHAESVENIRNVGVRTLDFRLGQIDVYDWFLGYQQQHEAAYEMILAEENPEEFDDPSL